MSKPVLTVDIEQKTAPGVWTKIGTLTRLQSAAFEYVTDGYYGTGSIAVQQRFNVDGFIALASHVTKRLVYRLNGVVVFVGISQKPVRSLDQLEVHHIPSIGLLDEMNRVWVRKQYVPSGGLQDLSWFYFRLAQDYMLPRGFCDHLQIEEIGVLRGSVTFDGPLRQCVTDIGTLAATYVYWGLRYETDGTITFFVSRRDPATAPLYTPVAAVADYDPEADRYPVVLQTIEHTGEDQDLVNRLWISGGPVTYPNLFTVNPSFEEIKQGGSSSSNMLKNGDFDESNSGAWDLSGGATIHSQMYQPPHTPPNYLELDTDGEMGDQPVRGITAGHTYAVDFQIANEDPPLGSFTLVSRMIYYASVDGSGTPLNGTHGDERTWSVDGFPWQGRTHVTQAPVGALSFRVQFESTHTANRPGHGIVVDTAILYDYGSVYQAGWRMESTATALGTDVNSDPVGIYLVDWTYDYARLGAVSPGLDYGAYGVHLHVFGLNPGTNGVRVMNSKEGETPVNEEQFYAFAITARAAQFDGSAPAAGNNFRVGIIWFDDSTPPVPRNLNVQDVHLNLDYKIVGGIVQVPKHAKQVRMYFEARVNNLDYYLDGAQMSQSPSLPTEFILGDKAHYVISVLDVYQPTDPQYASIASPPDGYGPFDETVDTPIVLTRSDARRYAKTVFDARALPGASEVLHVVQVDAPVTLYQPNGYVEVATLDGFVFPKLWPTRVGYVWDSTGLSCDLELEREVPRLDQVIEQTRRLAIIQVGTGADVPGLFVSAVTDTFVVVAADPRLSNSDRTLTLETSQPLTTLHALLAVRGFVQPIVLGDVTFGLDLSGAMQQVVVTLPVGDSFSTDDVVLLFYYPPAATVYALHVNRWLSPGSGVQQFTLPSTAPPILPGSTRAYVRGFMVAPADVNLLLDDAGQPTLMEIEIGEGLAYNDEVALVYDADPQTPRVPYSDEVSLLGTETQYTFSHVPYLWPDGTFAVAAWLRGFLFVPVVNVTGGVASFALPAIGAGDLLIVHWSVG